MELLLGESLQSYFKRKGRLSLKSLTRVAYQVLQGLAVAHEQSLVHRDIKPSNIWLETGSTEDSFRCKILDFGLARAAYGDSISSQSGRMIGTPAYMSPEQWAGRELDQRADYFSLGVMLYQLATGRLPFAGESHIEIARSIALDHPVPPSELNPEIPDLLNRLILALLSKDKDSRPSCPKEIQERLRESIRPTEIVFDAQIADDGEGSILSGSTIEVAASNEGTHVDSTFRTGRVSPYLAFGSGLLTAGLIVLLVLATIPSGRNQIESNDLKELRSQISLLQSNLSSTQDSRDKLDGEINQLRLSMNEQTQQLDHARQERKQLDLIARTAHDDLSGALTREKELTERISELEQSITRERTNAEKMLLMQSEKLREHQQNEKSLRDGQSQSLKDLAKSQDSIKQLEGELNSARKSILQQTQETQRFRDESSKFNQLLTQSLLNEQALSQRLDEMEERILSREREIASLQKRLQPKSFGPRVAQLSLDVMLAVAKPTATDIVYAINSPDGRLLATAVKMYPVKSAIGHASTEEEFQSMEKFLKSSGSMNKLTLHRARSTDLKDISEATLIVISGVDPGEEKPLSDFLRTKKKVNARIIGINMSLGDWKPDESFSFLAEGQRQRVSIWGSKIQVSGAKESDTISVPVSPPSVSAEGPAKSVEVPITRER
jgi:serine/threonine protein kinase